MVFVYAFFWKKIEIESTVFTATYLSDPKKWLVWVFSFSHLKSASMQKNHDILLTDNMLTICFHFVFHHQKHQNQQKNASTVNINKMKYILH